MNYDMSKLPPQQPQYMVERSIASASPVPKEEKNQYKDFYLTHFGEYKRSTRR